MKIKQTITRIFWNSILVVFLGTLLAAQAHGQIFVVNSGGGSIGVYNATTGATLNASLVSGLDYPSGIAVSGGNVFVASRGGIGVYNATTGATVNASLIPGLSLSDISALAVSGGNVFVANAGPYSGIGVYNATTGAMVNAWPVPQGYVFSIAVSEGKVFVARGGGGSYVSGISVYDATTGATINDALVSEEALSNPYGIAVSGGNVFVANGYTYTVAVYNATTGATVNASLIPGVIWPHGIAVAGGNLFVTQWAEQGIIGVYNATTGATVNAALVSGLSGPYGIALGESYSAQLQQPIDPDGSSVFNIKRGVVPVKFTLTSNGVATCQLPPATISLFRTAGTVLGSIDESTYLLASDNGSNFRIDGCQYVYNLATSSLGAGTYQVNILIGGNVVGSGTFGLK